MLEIIQTPNVEANKMLFDEEEEEAPEEDGEGSEDIEMEESD